jgi:hypothetical protein
MTEGSGDGGEPTTDEVERELRQLLLNYSTADPAYDAILETLNGHVLNTDAAREISPHYGTARQRQAFTEATYAPSRDYVFRRILRALGTPPTTKSGKAPRVLFLAGGPASGKTTSVGQALLERYDLVIDSTLSDLRKARVMIDGALIADWMVDVTYIHRPFGNAVADMLWRAEKTGRYVPLGPTMSRNLASLHIEAQTVFGKICEEYSAVAGVIATALLNVWVREKPLVVGASQISNDSLAKGGEYYYTSIRELYAIQKVQIEKVGSIDPALHKAVGV